MEDVGGRAGPPTPRHKFPGMTDQAELSFFLDLARVCVCDVCCVCDVLCAEALLRSWDVVRGG
jgi:hypothetical protein